MSVHTLRENGFPGVVMRYEEGGAVQVFIWNGKEVRLPAAATTAEIEAALRESQAS